LWSRSEQKYAKIPPPLSATTKLDFVFTRPGGEADIDPWEKMAGSVENDPNRKSRIPICCDATRCRSLMW
jgi:hypothetical protein